jgi:diguanylate cyclase (GGDEF)-like protein
MRAKKSDTIGAQIGVLSAARLGILQFTQRAKCPRIPSESNMRPACKVLIVEDSIDHQFLYEAMLERAAKGDFTSAVAGTAEAGLLAAQRDPPDCILLDLNLPDLDGLTFLERLRGPSGTLPCAVVIVTAHGSESVAVEAMKRGVQDYLVKGEIDAENLGRAIINAVDLVAERMRQEEGQAQLFHLALHDSLTGLANRRNFNDRLEHALELARRCDAMVTVLAMDLDGFKSLNDTHGHHAGDLALIEVAQRLPTVLRECDTVARLGGDEFAVLLEAQPTRSGALVVANKVIDAIKPPIRIEQQRIRVGISIGIAHSNGDMDAATLLRQADAAMYWAKRSGSLIAVFDAMCAPAHSRPVMPAALPRNRARLQSPRLRPKPQYVS